MLRAIYKTGSSCLLSKSNDYDIVKFYDTEEERKLAIRHHKRQEGVCVHYDLARPKIFLGCYIYPFMEKLEGEDLKLNEFSIFDHKQEYIKCLKRFASWLPSDNKLWYHIITACYMFKNNSYELTETQLKAIQSTHDKGITDTRKKFCLDTLEENSEKESE